MTRRAWCKRLAVCLVLGAVTTVAVAWSAVFISKGHMLSWLWYYTDEQPSAPVGWVVEYWGWAGRSRAFMWNDLANYTAQAQAVRGDFDREAKDWGVSLATLDAAARKATTGNEWVLEEKHGWPRAALWCALDNQDPSGRWIGGLKWPNGWTPTSGPMGPDPVAVPLLPIWSGLFVDTFVFTTLWWLFFSVPPFLLARRRRKRWRRIGHCPECGYDLEGGFRGGCPECGWGKHQ
jgi:hypothetical protein